MNQRCNVRRWVLTAAIAVVAMLPAQAEDIEKKWRIGFATGVHNPQDQVVSDAGNALLLFDDNLQVIDAYVDPRNDSGVFGVLDIQPSPVGTFYAQYAPTKTFLVEASIGYTTTDFGDVEVQAQFSGVDVPDFQPFDFSVFRIPVGEIERVPINLTGLMRFRPRASLNPYIGAGLTYALHGFSPTEAFNTLSERMDGASGALASLTPSFTGVPQLITPAPTAAVDLAGAEVEVDDTVEFHMAGGMEYSFKKKWAIIIDARWSFSSRKAKVRFNGGEDLGVAVPQRSDFIDSPAGTTNYGAMFLPFDGLVDGGALVPNSPTVNCAIDAGNCTFGRSIRDGNPDPGFYYVQGGEVDYGAVTFQVGLRYTF